MGIPSHKMYNNYSACSDETDHLKYSEESSLCKQTVVSFLCNVLLHTELKCYHITVPTETVSTTVEFNTHTHTHMPTSQAVQHKHTNNMLKVI